MNTVVVDGAAGNGTAASRATPRVRIHAGRCHTTVRVPASESKQTIHLIHVPQIN